MIAFEEALESIVRAASPLDATHIALQKARGRVLAADVIAPSPLPRFATSAVDGFALCAADLLSAMRGRRIELALTGEATAGNPLGDPLVSGQTVYVATGAKIPDGANAVVKREEVDLTTPGVAVFEHPVQEGEGIRSMGSDVAVGERILVVGTVVHAEEIGLLASLGLHEISVYRRPRVHILATGDELVDLGEDLSEGQIVSSTSHLLNALIKREGARPKILGIAPDRKKKLLKRMSENLDCDFLLVTGGTSKGRHDYLGEVVEELGVDVRVKGVRIRPGRPFLFGVKGKTLVCGLPGSPLSTYVTFLALVRPALRAMMGIAPRLSPHIGAQMSEEYSKHDDRRHLVPGLLHFDGTGWHVRPLRDGEERPFTTMARSTCLLHVPEDRRDLKVGEIIEVEPFPDRIFAF